MEKIEIEFEVEKERDVGYGIVEKYLQRFDEKTPYKAIVKSGEFVAIVKRMYVVVPNELFVKLCKQVADKVGMKMSTGSKGHRVYVAIGDDGIGIMAGNSIDCSMGIWVDALVKVEGGGAALSSGLGVIQNVYKRHSKNVTDFMGEFPETLITMIEGIEEFRTWLEELTRFRIQHEQREKIAELLEGQLPKKILAKATKMVKFSDSNLKQVYEQIAKDIWRNNKTEMKTKRQQYTALNKAILSIIELLK